MDEQAHLILGAGSGIGAALARRLACEGRRLLLHTGSNAAGLAAVARDCESAGAGVRTITGDLGTEATIDRILAEVSGCTAELDGFVFAAGYAIRGRLGAYRREAGEKAFLSMPMAFVETARGISDRLRGGRGRIVAVSAFSAHTVHFGGPSFTTTAPAKAALEAATRTLAMEFAQYGISVNSVVPGYVRKSDGVSGSLDERAWKEVPDLIPMGRLAQPEEIAAMISFLLKPEAGYVTGQSIRVDGGLTL